MNKITQFSIKAALVLTFLTGVGANSALAASDDASSCPSVDLRHDFDFGMTRNQKFLGWCYSYAAADMIGKHIGQNISSFDFAVQVTQERAKRYNLQSRNLLNIDGGNTYDIKKVSSEIGVCAGDQITSSHPLSADVLKDVEDTAIFVAEQRALGKLSDQDLQTLIFSKAPTFQLIFPKTNVWDLVTYFKALNNTSPALAQLFNQICKVRYPVKATWKQTVGSEMPARTKAQLKAGGALYIEWSEKTLENLSAPIGPAGHASSIIGMRFNKSKNTCEFLLRNTYGNYPQRAYDLKIRSQVENGNVWVSEDLFKKIVSRAIFLTN